MERWATFDCYGTLVDWNGGIHAELEKLFGVERADELLARYHELEPEIQAVESGVVVPGGAHHRARAARGRDRADASRGRGERSRSLAADWPVFERRAPGADRGARPRLAARDPLEHRSRPDRRLHREARRSRSSSRSSRGRSARTSPPTRTGKSSTRRLEPIAAGTSTSRKASSTTSSLRTSSGSRRSGSTGSASPTIRGRP